MMEIINKPLSGYDNNDILEIVAASSYVAWTNVLCGTQNKAQDKYFERMSSPEVGDLVLETTTHGRVKAIDRIGRLLSVTTEPYPDWEDDEPAPTRDIWTIETFDGRDFKWENCSFIVIPETPYNHQGSIGSNYVSYQ